MAGGKRKINKTREIDGRASSRPPWLLMRCEYKEEDSIMGLSTDPCESNQAVLNKGSLENTCLLRDG